MTLKIYLSQHEWLLVTPQSDRPSHPARCPGREPPWSAPGPCRRSTSTLAAQRVRLTMPCTGRSRSRPPERTFTFLTRPSRLGTAATTRPRGQLPLGDSSIRSTTSPGWTLGLADLHRRRSWSADKSSVLHLDQKRSATSWTLRQRWRQ